MRTTFEVVRTRRHWKPTPVPTLVGDSLGAVLVPSDGEEHVIRREPDGTVWLDGEPAPVVTEMRGH